MIHRIPLCLLLLLGLTTNSRAGSSLGEQAEEAKAEGADAEDGSKQGSEPDSSEGSEEAQEQPPASEEGPAS